MNRNILLVIIGAVILCFVALDNKFPVLTQDTGSYINSGFTRDVPFDRPVLYGLFISHASWGSSLWLVVFSQALILSIVLFYYFRYFSANIYFNFFYLACLFFITFCMTGSLAASKIAPGVFGGITLLGTGLMLFAKDLTQRDYWIILSITVISAGMDVAYLITLVLLVIIYGVAALIKGKGQVPHVISVNRKRVLHTGVMAVVAWLLISMIHFLLGAGFGITRDKHISVFPRLINTGLAKEYLDQHCEKGQPGICAYKDSLNKLITVNSRLVNAALTDAQIKAFREIVPEIISQNGFARKIVKRSVIDFFLQIPKIRTAKYTQLHERSVTYTSIYKWYNSSVRETYLSRQMARWLDFWYLNYSQIISVICCLGVFILVFFNKVASRQQPLFMYVFIAYMVYAFAGALLYGSRNDFQSDIVWVLCVPVFIYLSEAGFKNSAQKSGKGLTSPQESLLI
ncbi:hypothetical protein A3860_04945 [Niastella vici]|uniref:Glycosyltransferase RgtA/B/C/D-like domain-containing protein n=1 Tax=Niastella vici TaxID=1703345 RepID=A0A1V9FS02_9BACT|nr:hypothetical protein [Niastella vici]OQP61067.1 hypothetical protein A3860_04945 [Niastella vici]